MLAEHGVIVSHEAIRLRIKRFGQHFANCIKRDRPGSADKWHLDEVVISICGEKYWLWRAIDANGDVLDILVQKHRNTKAANRFLRRLVDRLAGFNNINTSLLWNGWFWMIDVLQVKHLNNVIEHRSHRLQANDCRAVDHRFIKGLTKHMKGFKSFNSASATLEGIEVAHMIRRQQFGVSRKSAFQHCAALAG